MQVFILTLTVVLAAIVIFGTIVLGSIAAYVNILYPTYRSIRSIRVSRFRR